MPGSRSFDPGYATRRAARRERRGALPDRIPGGPTRAPSRAIETAGSHDDRIEGGLRALLADLRRYDAPDRSLRRSRRSLRCPAITLAMSGTRLCVTSTSRRGRSELASSIGRASRLPWWPSSPGRRASKLRRRGGEPSVSGHRGFGVRASRLRGPPEMRRRPPGKLPSSGTQSIHAGHRSDPARSRLSRGSTFQTLKSDGHCLDSHPDRRGGVTFHVCTTTHRPFAGRPSMPGESMVQGMTRGRRHREGPHDEHGRAHGE
jgi:hypothetical protein